MSGRDVHPQKKKTTVMRPHGVAGICALTLVAAGSVVGAQPAMVPPEVLQLAETDDRADQSDQEVRPEQRLKQQGQEPHYRIEGVPQPQVNRTDAEDKARRGPGPGEIRQDTGLADPSVNPGQARRMETIEGKVLRHEGDRYVIARPGGKEATVLVDGDTTGDKALEPGDHIAATVTPQGRAVTVTKQARE